MSQKCKVRINLNGISDKKASSVRKALEPDNVNFPSGLSLNIEQKGNCLILNFQNKGNMKNCLLYTSPSPRDQRGSRMPGCG